MYNLTHDGILTYNLTHDGDSDIQLDHDEDSDIQLDRDGDSDIIVLCHNAQGLPILPTPGGHTYWCI